MPELDGKTSLKDFCRQYTLRQPDWRRGSPERLALALRRYCNADGELALRDIERIALEKLGVSSIEYRSSVGAGNGMFFKRAARILILVKEGDTDTAKAFTIAHEVREVIGVLFRELHPRFRDFTGEDLETEADVFASTLIVGEKAFPGKIEETGFDPVLLGRLFHLTARRALRRMVTALADLPDNPPFWGSVLTLRPNLPKGHLQSSGSFRNPKFGARSRERIPNFLFAKRGQFVQITRNLQRCLRYGKPLYIDSVVGLDHWNRWNLSVILRPVPIRRGVIRIIVLAIPSECSQKLSKQVLRLRPMRLEENFQLY